MPRHCSNSSAEFGLDGDDRLVAEKLVEADDDLRRQLRVGGFRGLLVEINRQNIGELDFFRMAAVFNNMLAGDVVG